jgi:ABC-2 type transport system permease protein
MSTQAATAGSAPAPARPASARATFVSDTWVIARRGLLHMRRQPEALSDATIQPVMFVLLFAFVFGGAIKVPGGGSYKEFLMGGIFAQTIVFGCFGVALALSNDRNNGAIDRFHSLPIPRSSVLAGHAVANLIRAFLPIGFMTITGFVVGWRIHSGVLDVLGAYGLMLVFSFAMIWVGVLLGSLVRTPEGVQGVAFVVIFPLTFIASTFVPTSTLPGVLKTIAEWNPTSSLANALRHLFENPGGVPPADGAWPLQHPVAYTLVWAIGIVVVCAPLAVMQYQRSIKS